MKEALLKTKNIFLLLLVTLFVLFLQLSWLPHLEIVGVIPNILLSWILLISLTFGIETLLPIIVFYLFVQCTLSSEGIIFYSWLVIPFLCSVFINKILPISSKNISLIFSLLFTLASSFLIEFFNFFQMFLLSEENFYEYFTNHWRIVVLNPILSTVFLVPLFFILNQFFTETKSRARSYDY